MSQESALFNRNTKTERSGCEKPANPHEHRDVPVVPVQIGGAPNGRPLVGDDEYLETLFAAFEKGLVTDMEWQQAQAAHRFVVAQGQPREIAA